MPEMDPDDLRTAVSELQSVNSLLESICRVRETNHIMLRVVNELVRLTDADQGVISLVNDDDQISDQTVVRARPSNPAALPYKVDQQVCGWVLSRRVVLKIDDLDNDPRFPGLISEDGAIKSIICAPMIARGEVVGLTTLVRRAALGPFIDAHARLVGIITSQSAQVLANAILLEDLGRKNALLQESYHRLQEENVRLADTVAGIYSFESIIGQSTSMRQVLTLASKVASNDSPVLITGPTGSGKELVARAIHYNSGRRKNPYVIKNCGVRTETLLESELFGHVRGAFTGADRDKPGLFREADGGTVFLDEIGDAPEATQTAILRVIENGEIRPVGASRPEYVDVRVISATNKDLKRAMEAGTFRSDLYYRINAVTILIPSLMERRTDIPLLIEHFLTKQRLRMNRPDLALTPDAMAALQRYHWPGNVRQLENEIERAAIVSDNEGFIDVCDLSTDVCAGSEGGGSDSKSGQLRDAVDRLEREMIQGTLLETNGNIQRSARLLGLTRKGLKDKISRYGIPVHHRD